MSSTPSEIILKKLEESGPLQPMANQTGSSTRRKTKKRNKKKNNKSNGAEKHGLPAPTLDENDRRIYLKNRHTLLDIVGANTEMDAGLVHDQFRSYGGEMLDLKKKTVKLWLRVLKSEFEEVVVHIKGAIFQDASRTASQITSIVQKEMKEGGASLIPSNTIVQELMTLHKLNPNDMKDSTPDSQIPRLYTVGTGEGAQYSGATSDLPAESLPSTENTWLPVALGVPAMDPTARPYQAVIGLKNNKTPDGDSVTEKGELFKVQLPLGPDPGVMTSQDVPMLMLMYNKDKSKKTFIHSGTPAFQAIKKLLDQQDTVYNGCKGFLYGREVVGKNVVFLNVDTLAPYPEW